MKTLRHLDITEDDVNQLDTTARYELIAADPVTCARYYDMRYRELFKVLEAKNGPFGQYAIIDYYIRVEFQHRGSPHVHCLLWLKDAPEYIEGNQVSLNSCVAFIDQFITTLNT